jgi:pimeloyl-ACP methyl ester carboxylesterase
MNDGWQTIDLSGKPADVFAPPDGPPRFALLFLHGYDLATLAGNAVFTKLLAEHRLACVCPHGGRCWWTGRVWPEFDPRVSAERYLLDIALPYLQSQWGFGERAIGLLGYCMGGQGALTLAFKHPLVFPAVAAISSAIEYHELYWSGTAIDELYASKEQARQDTAPMHVHPSVYPPHIFFSCDPGDPWSRGNDRLHEKLAALGVPHECDISTRAGGHSWQYVERSGERTIRFIVAGLEKESRRLV